MIQGTMHLAGRKLSVHLHPTFTEQLLLLSVMPMQAKIHVLCTSRPQQLERRILNMASLLRMNCRVGRDWLSGKSSRFQRDKFTGYGFAPFFDSLTDNRHHISMRGCRYTAPPITSTGSVVCRPYRLSIAEFSDLR